VIAFILSRSTTPTNSSSTADRQLQRDGIRAQPLLDLRHHAEKVRARAIHLVHERETRHAISVRLAPYRLGLRLDAVNGAEQRYGAVEHTQAALHFDREVDVARVSMMLMRCSGRFWSMPFQKQVVAADVIVMPRSCSCSIQSMIAAPSWTLADLVRDAGVEKDSLSSRVFPASMWAMMPMLR
jgi:hypothetical protein